MTRQTNAIRMRSLSPTVLLAAMTVFSAGLIGQSYADEAVAEPAAEQETITVLGEGKITVPGEFERVEPKSRIIAHEFQATEGEATARVTMMPAGGDVKMNINRWKGQFSNGDADKIKAEEMTIGDWTVHIADVNGNYTETMGGGPFSGGKKVKRTDYAMVGGILVDQQDRKFFVKLIGPAKVVDANRDRFIEMLKSIK